MIFGYARVSTQDQNLESQIDLLKNAGCEKIYKDVASGARSDRKGLNELIKYMREGDTVIAYKNDRVFRSLKNMVELIDKFNQAGVHFKSLSEPESSYCIYLLPVRNSKETLLVKELKSDLPTQGSETNYWADQLVLKKKPLRNIILQNTCTINKTYP